MGAMMYPELYKDLTKGRSLTYKTFFVWILISLYQGGIIMFGALLLFEDEFIHVVSISLTALTIRNFHWLMGLSIAFSVLMYVATLFFFKDYFDEKFIISWVFAWKTLLITAVSCLPLYFLKFLRKKLSPPAYQKLS